MGVMEVLEGVRFCVLVNMGKKLIFRKTRFSGWALLVKALIISWPYKVHGEMNKWRHHCCIFYFSSGQMFMKCQFEWLQFCLVELSSTTFTSTYTIHIPIWKLKANFFPIKFWLSLCPNKHTANSAFHIRNSVRVEIRYYTYSFKASRLSLYYTLTFFAFSKWNVSTHIQFLHFHSSV